MSLSSYSDVFSIRHECDEPEDIRVGDLVRTGPNLFPHFTVIAIADGTAWLRNVQTGHDGLTALNRCRRINGQTPE